MNLKQETPEQEIEVELTGTWDRTKNSRNVELNQKEKE